MTNVRGETKKKVLEIIAVSVVTVLVVVLTAFLTVGAKANKNQIISSDQSAAISKLNDIRASSGLYNLEWNNKLAEAAKTKAEDMITRDYFDHVNPDGDMVWKTIEGDGYTYLSAGENLAIDFNNISQAYDSWMKSPSHKENIVSSKYTDFGFAVAEGEYQGRQTRVYVQIFASPEPIYDQILSNLGGNNG